MPTVSRMKLSLSCLRGAFVFTALALFTAVAFTAQANDNSAVTVQMQNADGDSVGTVEVKALAQGVLFVTHLKDMEQGTHAFHVHENAKCDPPDFKSAGDHYNPGNNKHGFDSKQGYHAGDLPNIHVTKQGVAETEIFAPQLVLRQSNADQSGADDGHYPLLKDNGTALIIHKTADDYGSQPAGDAGPRIACGVIQQQSSSRDN